MKRCRYFYPSEILTGRISVRNDEISKQDENGIFPQNMSVQKNEGAESDFMKMQTKKTNHVSSNRIKNEEQTKRANSFSSNETFDLHASYVPTVAEKTAGPKSDANQKRLSWLFGDFAKQDKAKQGEDDANDSFDDFLSIASKPKNKKRGGSFNDEHVNHVGTSGRRRSSSKGSWSSTDEEKEGVKKDANNIMRFDKEETVTKNVQRKRGQSREDAADELKKLIRF